MSLCLALLLAAIAINWWNGWKPFTHPFQMPRNPWLRRPSNIHSKRRRSTPGPRPIVDAREPPSTLLGGSRRPTNHEVSSHSISLVKAANSEGMVDTSDRRLTGRD
jgi:hypothetical protein